ncbi:MAG: glycosyltransferase [Candidatus Omnitrophica bacterium]|nr:glycosyltransferase [Candidatus Omnitrophota bacterium]
MNQPFVSVVMPCANEIDFISKSLGSLLRTEYPMHRLEILVVLDSYSDDGTRAVVKQLHEVHSQIRLVENPYRIVPVAMNIGIRAAKGEIIVRVDAHTEYPPEYICKCVEYLEKTDAWCVGGPFYNVPATNTLMAKVISAVLSCPFLVADARFRTKQKPMYVETVPYGAFRREVFDRVGFYDERLTRHQDFELCRRISRAGGKIFLTPEIKNYYYPRKTLRAFLRMAVQNGYWDAVSTGLCPHSFAWRHFVPGPFFLGTVAGIGCVVIGAATGDPVWFLGAAPVALYFGLACFFSASLCRMHRFGVAAFSLIPFVCFLFHFWFGFGLIKGLAQWLCIRWPRERSERGTNTD